MTNKAKQSRKERYEYWKSEGICPNCGADAADGHVYCLSCLDDLAVRQMIRRASMTEEEKNAEREQIARDKKMRYDRRISEGICPKCGKFKISGQKKACVSCLIKASKSNQQRYVPKTTKKEWIANGCCPLCGEKSADGYKLCQKHLELTRINTRKSADLRRRKFV